MTNLMGTYEFVARLIKTLSDFHAEANRIIGRGKLREHEREEIWMLAFINYLKKTWDLNPPEIKTYVSPCSQMKPGEFARGKDSIFVLYTSQKGLITESAETFSSLEHAQLWLIQEGQNPKSWKTAV